MIPALYDFTKAVEGDTHDGVSITVTTTTGNTTTPINLTSVAIAMQVRSATDAIALNLAVGSGITKTSAAAGIFTVDAFTVPAAGVYTYDIEFTYADSSVKTYMSGHITSVAGVTA